MGLSRPRQGGTAAGALEEAAELLEQAVARAPDDREGSYLLAMTDRELGRDDSARRHLERLDRKSRAWPPDPLMELIRTGRQDLQSLVQMANRMLAQGDAEGAEALYRTVLDADPAHFDALFNLGIVRRREGRLAEAEASFQAAIRSRPDDAEAHFALAVTYASRRRLERPPTRSRRSYAWTRSTRAPAPCSLVARRDRGQGRERSREKIREQHAAADPSLLVRSSSHCLRWRRPALPAGRVDAQLSLEATVVRPTTAAPDTLCHLEARVRNDGKDECLRLRFPPSARRQ